MLFSPRVDLLAELEFLDFFVFISSLILTFSVVFYSHLKQKRTKQKESFLDYMLMGRRLTLPFFIATLVATWYGGIFGVTEIAFESGLYNFITQGVFWYITYFIFALFLVDKIKAYEAITLPELAGEMFGKNARLIAAIFNFFNVVPVTYTISLGIFIKVFTGVSLFYSCLLGVGFACFYSLFGGFRAIVLSDFLQFFIMCFSVALVLFYSVNHFGLSFLFENLPEAHFSFTGKNSLLTTFSWGFIALGTLVNPGFYQRCFAAETTSVAKKGIFVSTLIWFLFDLCTTLGAMYAAAVIPEAIPTEAYLTYSLQLLPHGLRGFFLAGVAATILSTIDSYLFIASNTLSYDLAPKRWKKSIVLSKLSMLFTGLFSILLAMAFSGSIKSVWKTLGSYSAGCLLLPIVLGYLKKNLVTDALFTVMTMSSAIGITLWRYYGTKDIDDLYIGLFLGALSFLVTTTLTLALNLFKK